jgi:hypothetical protein
VTLAEDAVRVLNTMGIDQAHVMGMSMGETLHRARLKSRLRPMRGLKQLRCARIIGAGHAFIQSLHRGHYELGLDANPRHRIPQAFTELVLAI